MKGVKNIFHVDVKSEQIIAFVIIFVGAIISILYITTNNKWFAPKHASYPLEEWEETKIWQEKGGVPSFHDMPLWLRGSLEKIVKNRLLYRNHALGFEIESLSNNKPLSFENLLDDSPYNKTYEIKFSGPNESFFIVSVRDTRFSSLDQWLAVNPVYTEGAVSIDQWTTISGERAVITAEKGDFVKPPIFEEVRRKAFIIKDRKLYTIDAMRVPQEVYQRTLRSFKFLD